eukprot:TRINITY_DN1964_c0_g1_i1.p1 TRINITY_DN1964_c0_g1~~TRINITY_DN1964_c0_g1_i1.p1  ORF type:complete len:68 (-),score=3.88 TRINITY_DN1964_c0_g1_i1:51-254(-)
MKEQIPIGKTLEFLHHNYLYDIYGQDVQHLPDRENLEQGERSVDPFKTNVTITHTSTNKTNLNLLGG